MTIETVKALESAGLKIVSPLNKPESLVLDLLVSKNGFLTNKSDINDALYSRVGKAHPASNCVEVYVSRLRRKLNNPYVIRTIRGRGYVFKLPPSPSVPVTVPAAKRA